MLDGLSGQERHSYKTWVRKLDELLYGSRTLEHKGYVGG
jgi:hypothetical protein